MNKNSEQFKHLFIEVTRHHDFDKSLSHLLADQFKEHGKPVTAFQEDLAKALINAYQLEIPTVRDLFSKFQFPIAMKFKEYLTTCVAQLSRYIDINEALQPAFEEFKRVEKEKMNSLKDTIQQLLRLS